jgi:hypothetical protein
MHSVAAVRGAPTELELFLINQAAVCSLVNVISECDSCQSARYDQVCLGFFEGAIDAHRSGDRWWRLIKGTRSHVILVQEKNRVISSYWASWWIWAPERLILTSSCGENEFMGSGTWAEQLLSKNTAFYVSNLPISRDLFEYGTPIRSICSRKIIPSKRGLHRSRNTKPTPLRTWRIGSLLRNSWAASELRISISMNSQSALISMILDMCFTHGETPWWIARPVNVAARTRFKAFRSSQSDMPRAIRLKSR